MSVKICCVDSLGKVARCQNLYIIKLLTKDKIMDNDINVVNNLDISIWGLIIQADLVVRIVMLILLFLSNSVELFLKLTRLRN